MKEIDFPFAIALSPSRTELPDFFDVAETHDGICDCGRAKCAPKREKYPC